MKVKSQTSRSPILTAVCCDLVGSTAKQQPGSGLAPDSESRAEDFRDAKNRLEVRVRREMKRFGGDQLHASADNFSGAFDNPEHALVCALVIQQSLRSDPVLLGQGRMEIRIGLHTGATHRDDTNYLGDPGNVAARLHAYAPPGGVVVSARTREVCGDLEGIEWTELGRREPKGLHQPITVFEARCTAEVLLRLVPRLIERTGEQRKPGRRKAKPHRTAKASSAPPPTVHPVSQFVGQQIAGRDVNNIFQQTQRPRQSRGKHRQANRRMKISKVIGQVIHGNVTITGDQNLDFRGR